MLIKIINRKNSSAISVNLDKGMNLLQVRERLETQGIMSSDVMFINDGSIISKKDEVGIDLEELLGAKKEITVGLNGDINQSLNVSDFTMLTNSEIMDFFKKKQLYRGLIFSETKGVIKSFSDIFTLTNVPNFNIETQNTYSSSYYAFSKQSCDISLITSNKSSLSLNTPFLDASVEYTQQKSTKSHSETVTEYLLTKFVVSLMSFKINPEDCLPSEEFIIKINDIMAVNIEPEQKVVRILKVLDEYGLYIPIEFTMGGALYATETTEIQEFSIAETQKNDFSAKAEAKFNGSGGGSSTSSSTEEGDSVSTSKKDKVITVQQIGGTAGNTENKDVFKSSLDKLSTWAIVDIYKFYPSVLLLAQADKIAGVNPMLFIKVKNLLTKFSMHKFVKDYQPYINMQRYIDVINETFDLY